MPAEENKPIVTAEKYIAYKRKNGLLKDFHPPKIVIICYQQSALQHLLKTIPNMKLSQCVPNLYLFHEGQIGVLGGWGLGAPALSVELEELIVLGVKKFIAVGMAGTLLQKHAIADFIVTPKALAEDGVAHLYLEGKHFAEADKQLLREWNRFVAEHSLPHFHEASTWSFSTIYKETPEDIDRVTKLGYDVVDMEAATLYAIGQDKGVQTLSLFVISDSITLVDWTPLIKEQTVSDNLHRLAQWVVTFCRMIG